MSSLSYIRGYGSSSEDSDTHSEDSANIVKRTKLPTPDLGRVVVIAADEHVDIPGKHNGRTRTFAHVRGNWASYVYVKYPQQTNLINLISKFLAASPSIDLQVCDDLHISLSRTVTLSYHLITPFTHSLQTALEGVESFDLGFESVKLYCNEENNRTFISLAVDHFSERYLLKIVKKVDEILADYKLPTFYKDPSLHMSILWVNGNKKADLFDVLEIFNNILYKEIDKLLATIKVDKVNCKIGNKFFQFSLQ